MKKPFLFAALAAVLMTPTAPAWAQAAYPTKPIKIVVPFPAGGTSDVLARIVGQKMTESWGQPVVIENRPGSSGNLGADLVAKSPADGHTLVLMDVGNLVISPALFKLPFNVEKDFAPVAMVAYSPHLLAVSTKVPANTPAELVAYAKAQKGKLNYAVAAGMGSASHLAGVMYAQRNGIEWGYVPYKGGAQAITDLIGGQVDVMFNGMVATYPHVKAGKLRALAVTSKERNALYPDVPTIAESGYKGFEALSWSGLSVAKGTPQPIVDKLEAAISQAMQSEGIKQRMASVGFIIPPQGSKPYTEFVKKEIDVWGKVIKTAGIKAE